MNNNDSYELAREVHNGKVFWMEPRTIVGMASEHSEGTLTSQHHQSPRPLRFLTIRSAFYCAWCVWLLIAVKFAVSNFLESNSTLTKFRRNFAAAFTGCFRRS